VIEHGEMGIGREYEIAMKCPCCRGARAEGEDGCGQFNEWLDVGRVVLRLEIRYQPCEPSKSIIALKRVQMGAGISRNSGIFC
jgi:hypothetical protein